MKKNKMALLVVIGLLLIAGAIIFTLTLRDVNASVGLYCPNCNDYVGIKCQEDCPVCGQAIPHNLEWKYFDSSKEAGYCTYCDDGEIKSYREHTLTTKVSSEYYHYYYCENCQQKIGEIEEHNYVDSICKVCNHSCAHPKLNCSLVSGTHIIVCNACGIGVNGLAGITEPATVTKYNDSQHWKMCTGCWNYLPDTYETHTFNNSPKCTGCDYTCSHSGQTGETCTVCGTSIGPHEHDWSNNNGICADENCGYECLHKDESGNSTWVERCELPTICSICGLVGGSETIRQHEWVAATCISPRYCKYCKATDNTGFPGAHIPDTDRDNNEVYHYGENKHWQICSVCDEKINESTHIYTETIVNPTCTENGYTLKECVCGYSIKEENTSAALNHDYQYTDNNDGATHKVTCSRCDYVANEPHQGNPCVCSYEKHYHDYTYDSVVTNPTCTGGGYTTHYCSCGDNYTDSYTKSLGHDWKEATCTEAKTCQRCGATEGVAKGHTEVTDKAVAATCTATGKTEGKHCEECGKIIKTQTTTPALGHDWKEATCTEAKTCQRCGATEGNAKGHTYTKWEDNGDGTHQAYCKECDYSEKETHTYGTDNKCTKCNAVKDTTCSHTPELDKKKPTETQHFYKCTKCGTTTKTENHTFKNGKCTVCDYVCKHSSTTKKKDETNHWDECDNCGEKLNKEEHEYENGKCECGKIESNKHTHTPKSTYEKNDTYHWRICSECGKIVGEKEQHKDENNDKKCDVCGYTINDGNTGNDQNGNDGNNSNSNSGNNDSECKHENREWKTEGEEHYQVCKDCGKEIDGTRGKHNFVDGECKNCKTKEETSSSKLPNTGIGTITIMITAFIGLATLGAIKMKKYKEI